MLLRPVYAAMVLVVLASVWTIVLLGVPAGRRKWSRRFAILASVSALAFPLLVLLHNIVSSLLAVEEPVFFVLAVIGAPAALLTGVVGALVSLALVYLRPTPVAR